MIQYRRNIRFEKQIAKLIHKFKTLEEDLEIAQKAAIELLHSYNIDNHSVVRVTGFEHETIKIYKIKKFACRSLKGKGSRSGIRIIYVFYPGDCEVEYLEIYYKEKDDTDMDYDFIKEFLRDKSRE